MLRTRILDDIHEMWKTAATRASLGTPPEDFAVFEHTKAKLEEARCLGKGKLVELLDRNCAPLVAPADYDFDTGSRQDSYWQHARALFFVDKTDTEGVLEMRFGPKFGRGFSYLLIQKGDRPEIVQQKRWVS